MEMTESTNVEWGDARLVLGAVYLTSASGSDVETNLATLLSSADNSGALRQRMIEAIDRLLGDGGPLNLDLSQTEMAMWTADLAAVRQKLQSRV